jgi:hypothetical protein
MNALPLHAFGFVWSWELVSATADAASRQKFPTKLMQVKPKQGWRNTGFALKVECNLCPGGMV